MTLIEFYDDNAIQNAFSTLLFCPQRLILVGTTLRNMHAFRERFSSVLRMRKIECFIEIVTIDVGNYENILKKLSDVIQRYSDCVFDISGGAAQYLVAAGMLSGQYGVPMHTVDPMRENYAILSGSNYPKAYPVQLSVEEMIQLYGGKVYGAYAPAPHDEVFRQAVFRAWKVCRKNCILWNAAIGAMHHVFHETDPLHCTAKKEEMKRKLSPQKLSDLQSILQELSSAGLLECSNLENEEIHLTYKNQTAKRLLAKEGNVLEFYTYLAATTPGGPPLFFDAATGVMIDWQANTKRRPIDNVTNEIDVLLTRGAVPVFVSCKNGFTDTDELYKLSVVAERFGGANAKKVLVLSRFIGDDSFRERARNLGVFILSHAANLSFRAFSDKLRNVLFR